jgi:hypothetical protein
MSALLSLIAVSDSVADFNLVHAICTIYIKERDGVVEAEASGGVD